MAVILTAEQQTVVRELAELRAEQAKIKRQCDQLRDELLASLQLEEPSALDPDSGHRAVVGVGADAVVRGLDPDTGKVILTVGCEMRNHVNSAKLQAMWPDVWSEVHEQRAITVVRTP